MNDRVPDTSDDVLIEADEWADLTPTAAPLSASAELQRQVDEFLARGGQIKEFECGETAIPASQCLWSFPVGKAAEPDPVKKEQSENRRRKAQNAAQKRGTSAVRLAKLNDDEMIVIIDQQLGVAKTKKELREALGCSDNLLQRLLFQHFRNDDRAAPYRAVSRLDHEAEQVEQIRKLLAEGQTGVANITKLMGLKTRVLVAKLAQKYGLKIPRDEPSAKLRVPCSNTLCSCTVSPTARYCPQCGTITARGLRSNLENERC